MIGSVSGPFVLISNCYSNVVRAEGESGKAMMGQLIGNLLNIILDPILILVFSWNIAWAAIATVIGNVVGASYYILFFVKGKSTLSIHLKDFSVKGKAASGVLSIGIPAALGNLLMSVSSILMNMQMAKYGDMALAGVNSKIVPDEVIDAMRSIGIAMPSCIKETGSGGLAATPCARNMMSKLEKEQADTENC